MDIPFRPPTPFLEKKMALAHQYESLTSEELLEWACYFCCLATPPFFLASRTCAVAGSSYKRKRKTKSLCIVLPSTPSLRHACGQLGRIPATGATYREAFALCKVRSFFASSGYSHTQGHTIKKKILLHACGHIRGLQKKYIVTVHTLSLSLSLPLSASPSIPLALSLSRSLFLCLKSRR